MTAMVVAYVQWERGTYILANPAKRSQVRAYRVGDDLHSSPPVQTLEKYLEDLVPLFVAKPPTKTLLVDSDNTMVTFPAGTLNMIDEKLTKAAEFYDNTAIWMVSGFKFDPELIPNALFYPVSGTHGELISEIGEIDGVQVYTVISPRNHWRTSPPYFQVERFCFDQYVVSISCQSLPISQVKY